MNAQPILYSFRRCPYAMRARFSLINEGVIYEHREISLKDKPLEMLDISPKGTVPVLLLPDGRVLEESLDIMLWATGASLSPRDKELIAENDSSFKRALDAYKYPQRYPQEQGVNSRDICILFLHKLENLLHSFISGAKPMLVDMALFPFIRQFSRVDPPWFEAQAYPQLKRWLGFFLASELFQKVMQHHPRWIAPTG